MISIDNVPAHAAPPSPSSLSLLSLPPPSLFYLFMYLFFQIYHSVIEGFTFPDAIVSSISTSASAVMLFGFVLSRLKVEDSNLYLWEVKRRKQRREKREKRRGEGEGEGEGEGREEIEREGEEEGGEERGGRAEGRGQRAEERGEERGQGRGERGEGRGERGEGRGERGRNKKDTTEPRVCQTQTPSQ